MTNPESFADIPAIANKSEIQATFEQMTDEELERAATIAAIDFGNAKTKLDAIVEELNKREAKETL